MDGAPDQVVSRLVGLGLGGKYVQEIASAAIKYADEETDKLGRQLVPPSTWPGTVVCRKHDFSGTSAWLILKRGGSCWTLDSALFG